MKKIISLFLIFITCVFTIDMAFGGDNIEKSKGELTKQLILSKMLLNKSNKGKNDIKSVDLLVSKLDKAKLDKIYLKIDKIDTSSSKLSKYKNMLDYLEAKIGLELLKYESDNIDNNNDSTLDGNVIEDNNNIPDNNTIEEENTNKEQFYKISDSNIEKLGVGISDLESTDMDFSKSETQKIGFTISFDISIYTEPGRETLVSKHDTFGFRITNLTTGESTTIPSYGNAFPGTINKLGLLPEFFGDKNGKHLIKIEAISNNIHVYSDYYGIDNITEFYVDVKGIGTGASKKVSVGETSNDCKTVLNGITYTLEPCGPINIELTDGNGDKTFKLKVKASKTIDSDVYTNIYGNKRYQANTYDGFPHYALGVSDESLIWGYKDYIDFKGVVSDRYLNVGTYSGVIYIGLIKGNVTPKNWLNVPINVKVKKDSSSAIDYCKTMVGDATVYLDPCKIKLTHLKSYGNEFFNFKVLSSDGKSYSYGYLGNLDNSGAIYEYVGVPKYSLRTGTSGGSTDDTGEIGYFVDEYLDIGKYNTTIYIPVSDSNGLNVRPLRLPVEIEVKKPTKENDYCSTVLEGVTYKLEPCSISTTMIKGEGDKYFDFKIVASNGDNRVSFNTYGNGENLPVYGVMQGGSGGIFVLDNNARAMHFTEKVFEKGTYKGYLKINVTGKYSITQELRLGINLQVK